jgi:7,8-dihydropterin-6-yl-methyl-4-(beta-D-ribofuranosyl)aminobenzene 5'-phosphate synthase
MNQIEDFGAADQAAVTVLVDNRADLIVESSDTIKYFTDEPLLAEHGYSVLIDLNEGERCILWDAGITEIALLENMRRMEIDPKRIDTIALSHGHGDHTAAMTLLLKALELHPEGRRWDPGTPTKEMLQWAEGRRVPLVAHPAAFRERWGEGKDGSKWGPVQPPPRAEWEAAGAEIVLSKAPYQLGPGCWTTGAVPRRSFEKSGIPTSLLYRVGDTFERDFIEEDQAIILHIKGKGLVVLSGCAHSGIVNTINYGREMSGVDTVWAVLGGFHMARSTAEEIQDTIDAIKALEPALVVPSHCTGFEAIRQFAAQMPEQFAQGVVGTTYLI